MAAVMDLSAIHDLFESYDVDALQFTMPDDTSSFLGSMRLSSQVT
jgi:hypothetical protein